MVQYNEAQLKVIFNLIDNNNSGIIDVSDLTDYIQKDNQNIQVMDVIQILDMIDLEFDSYDNKLNLAQFIQFMYVFQNSEPENVCQIIFYVSDNFTGKLDRNAFKNVTEKMEVPMTYEQLNTIMKQNTNETGRIYYSTFKEILDER
ncbi:EF_hand domain-containing protein [Hexamita inflata]|uniref:EF hand domain-containing protein n=1 Tax=Hexamita inflata TaxID=28002 RepID=A0AA86PLZ8_9EUKA|nr:EF hand domain-containing protein [Hexamita inflata]